MANPQKNTKRKQDRSKKDLLDDGRSEFSSKSGGNHVLLPGGADVVHSAQESLAILKYKLNYKLIFS